MSCISGTRDLNSSLFSYNSNTKRHQFIIRQHKIITYILFKATHQHIPLFYMPLYTQTCRVFMIYGDNP